MDELTRSLVAECKRQEESCLYTSTALFEWLRSLRRWRVAFVVAPVAFGAIGSWPLLKSGPGLEWLTGICVLVAAVLPAAYKALNFDVSLEAVSAKAHEFKILQDRFRQAWSITALRSSEDLGAELNELMDRMDDARAHSITAPERFFRAAQTKVGRGDYSFTVDVTEAKVDAHSGPRA